MKYILIYLIILLLSSCNSYERIGNFKYRVKIEKANTGDFDGLTETIKFYYHRNKTQLGITIKSQKLHFQAKRDTIYSISTINFDESNMMIYITERFFNGYEKYQHLDSIQRIYKQDIKGNIKIKKYIEYPGNKTIFYE